MNTQSTDFQAVKKIAAELADFQALQLSTISKLETTCSGCLSAIYEAGELIDAKRRESLDQLCKIYPTKDRQYLFGLLDFAVITANTDKK